MRILVLSPKQHRYELMTVFPSSKKTISSSHGCESAEHTFTLPKFNQLSLNGDGESDRSRKFKMGRRLYHGLPACLLASKTYTNLPCVRHFSKNKNGRVSAYDCALCVEHIKHLSITPGSLLLHYTFFSKYQKPSLRTSWRLPRSKIAEVTNMSSGTFSSPTRSCTKNQKMYGS